jgi:hypothetical protein
VLRFRTGTQDKALRLTVPVSTTARTVFAVVRPTAVGAAGDGLNRDIWCGDNGSLKLGIREGKTAWVRIGGGMVLFGTTAWSASASYVVAATFGASAAAIYLNGGSDGSTTHSTTLSSSTGSYMGGSTGAG